jgi:hypothetical protein
MNKLLPAFAALLLAGACAGTAPSPSPTEPPPTQTAVLATNAAQSAVTALKTHDSWQYTVTTYEPGSPSFSHTITGTQTSKTPASLQFTVAQTGKPTLTYVRIGTDVWYDDAGKGSYTTSKASDNYVNLEFQPFFSDSIVEPAETQGYEFNSVGPDAVGGVTATHYRLADAYIESVVGNATGVTAADWAADLWTSDADGSLLRLTWGPQTLDKAQGAAGFDYEVTALDCSCPVKRPTTASN